MTEQPKPFKVEITVNAARDAVWHAMTTLDQIREWFGWDYDGLDGEIRYIFVDHVELHPPERLEFGNGSFIELVADGPRTVIRAVMPGALDGTDWDEIYDGLEEGWRAFFEQLRFLLETGPQGRRRTIYLTGTTTGAQAVALSGIAEQRRHTSRCLQMAVNADGHLVGVASQAPLASDHSGQAAITISTYGLGDAAFTALREDWQRRWSAVADGIVTTDTDEAPATSHAP